jgi:hypothetical protein
VLALSVVGLVARTPPTVAVHDADGSVENTRPIVTVRNAAGSVENMPSIAVVVSVERLDEHRTYPLQ